MICHKAYLSSFFTLYRFYGIILQERLKMTARKYEFLTDGSEALIAQFVKEPSEEAALKVFNEVSRHNTLSSNELKNIAIDEIRKEIQTLATKDELKLSHDSIHDRLSSIENRFASMENRFLSVEDRFVSMENRLSSMENRFEKRFLSIEDKIQTLATKDELNKGIENLSKLESRNFKFLAITLGAVIVGIIKDFF